MTDALPAGLSAPSPLSASSGTPTYDPATRRITWTGTPALSQAVTVTFATTVAISGPAVLSNSAVLSAESGATSTASVSVIVDSINNYLPVMLQ
jgi:hypothetical protein